MADIPDTPVRGSMEYPQEEADRVFDVLGELSVELDDDPLPFGPKRLNSKTAQIRRMLDRCEKLFLDVSRRLQATRRALRVALTDLDLAKKDLFANDPTTRAGRSVSDREAIASGKLRDEIMHAHNLNIATEDLEAVMAVIKAKRADLKDTEGRLRDQMRLCSEEIGLGGRWGTKVPYAPDIKGSPAQRATGDDVLDLDNLLRDVDGEIKLSREAGTWNDPEDLEDPSGEILVMSVPEIVEPQVVLNTPEIPAPANPSNNIVTDVEIAVVSVSPEASSEVSASDMLDGGNDVTTDLPSTTSTDQVDEFLDEVVISGLVPRAKPNLAKIVDDIDVDAILGIFEDPR